MSRKILVASYTSDIITLSWDPAASPPSLSVVSTLEAGHQPCWITPHTTDSSLIFTVNEQTNGKVKALKYDLNTGKGSVIGEASSGGADPCHIVMSGNELMVANYSGGNVAIFPISSSSPYLSPKPNQVVSFTGSGPIISRQETSHPHQVVVHPIRQEVLVPDLGSDKIWRLSRDGSSWQVSDHIDISPGGGPRHAVILGETLYTVLELSNMLTSHKLPPLPARDTAISALPTLSSPPKDPTTIDPPLLNAEISSPPISAYFPIPYLYVTNRNDSHPAGDILTIFDAREGNLKLINEIRTGLKHLRSIAFDEQGKWLIAGGTFGGGVKMFERVDGGRNLKEVAHLEDVEKPTGFHWFSTE